MKSIWKIIKAIEDAEIEIVRVYWVEESHLQIDVDPSENDRAVAAVEAMWIQEQAERIEHIGLIAVPFGEGESA